MQNTLFLLIAVGLASLIGKLVEPDFESIRSHHYCELRLVDIDDNQLVADTFLIDVDSTVNLRGTKSVFDYMDAGFLSFLKIDSSAKPRVYKE